MTDVTLVMLDGSERVIPVSPSQTLMTAIRDAGIDDLRAICFGCCSCGLCEVYVEKGADAVPPPSEDEAYVLAGSPYRTSQSRLSCQLWVPEGTELRVRVAPSD